MEWWLRPFIICTSALQDTCLVVYTIQNTEVPIPSLCFPFHSFPFLYSLWEEWQKQRDHKSAAEESEKKVKVSAAEQNAASMDNEQGKRKADAIDEINKLMKQLVGKTIIKTKKDPADKRQLIYYYKRNLLN